MKNALLLPKITNLPLNLLPITVLSVELKEVLKKPTAKISINAKYVTYHEDFYKPIVLIKL
jgi:hypothetical protein